MRAEEVVLVLLAAGRSTRMGAAGNKLEQPLRGRALGLHVAEALAAVPFRARYAVVAPGNTLDYAALGLDTVVNDDPVRDLSSSLRLGVRHARSHDPAAVLVALADMPLVTAAHVRRVTDAGDGDEALVASSDGNHPSPPALFGRAHFAALDAATGDAGARALIRTARPVVAGADELVDVDTPEELARLCGRARRGVTARSG